MDFQKILEKFLEKYLKNSFPTRLQVLVLLAI